MLQPVLGSAFPCWRPSEHEVADFGVVFVVDRSLLHTPGRAIGMAMQIAARRVRNHPQDYHQFKIFSDSQYSIGILTQGWKSRTHPKLACKLRHLYNNFPIPISIEWVPAHVGIDSNERADELADRGAKKSAKKGADTNAAADFERGDFQPVRNG